MILHTVFGLALVITASLDAGDPSLGTANVNQLSMKQKEAAILPLVRNATDCIARTVSADSRFTATLQPGELNELIVDAMSSCTAPVRAMIDGHDRMFGQGSGEAFFMGPYLDVLPAAVTRQVKAPAAE